MKVTSVSEMRSLDRSAIADYGMSDEILMENAGLAVCSAIREEIGIEGKKFLVVCGIGNNGGDGLVVARQLHSRGGEVRVLFLSDPAKFKGTARANFSIISRLPIEQTGADDTGALEEKIERCDVVVDAVFGTGLVRRVDGLHREAIEAFNRSSRTVVSLDIPSGINGDSGQVMGAAVRADLTVTFGLPKIGNILYPGFAHCGKLFVSHISFPPALYDSAALKVEVSRPASLPERAADSHKGNFGDVLFIAGAASYFGAPTYAALSFLKAGGGYSRLASPASVVPFIAGRGGQIVFAPMAETSEGSLALANKSRLLELAEAVDMVVIGPGLSLNSETQELVRQFVPQVRKPLLVDGDGISAISKDPSLLAERSLPTILTPHGGEMSRLAGLSIEDIAGRRISLLQEKAKEWKAVVVLKGAHSLIGFPDGRVLVNMSGNSGMATAGSGDVLTGTVPAMFGLGLPLEEAVTTGVFLHGLAGDLAARKIGEDGLTAQDIMDHLPEAVSRFRHDHEDIVRNGYGRLFTL